MLHNRRRQTLGTCNIYFPRQQLLRERASVLTFTPTLPIWLIFVHFPFNAPWLDAFHYVNPLLVMIMFLIEAFLIYAQSFRKAGMA
jgi:hypothetical protein